MTSPLPKIRFFYEPLDEDEPWLVRGADQVIVNSNLPPREQRAARKAALAVLRGRHVPALLPASLLLYGEAIRRAVAAHPVGTAALAAMVGAVVSGLTIATLPSGEPDRPSIAVPAPQVTASPTPPPEPTPSETVEPEPESSVPVVEPERVDFRTAADTSPSPEELEPEPEPVEPAPEPEPEDPGPVPAPEPEPVDEVCTGLLGLEAELPPLVDLDVCLVG